MNPTIIAKYRKVDWYFATYEGIELQAVYFVKANALEPFFKKWESKWHEDGRKDINNPKIPLSFIEKNGREVYKAEVPVVPVSPPKPPFNVEEAEGQ
jgi:type II restriction enzyme